MTSQAENRAREILARLAILRQEEQSLSDELFDLTEANGWYSQTQIEEMERDGLA